MSTYNLIESGPPAIRLVTGTPITLDQFQAIAIQTEESVRFYSSRIIIDTSEMGIDEGKRD
jgi:hypothetical protein